MLTIGIDIGMRSILLPTFLPTILPALLPVEKKKASVWN